MIVDKTLYGTYVTIARAESARRSIRIYSEEMVQLNVATCTRLQIIFELSAIEPWE
jgi:hypothetical protein